LEKSGSAMNPGSCLNDEIIAFALIDAVTNDLFQIVSWRSTVTAEEV